METVSGHLSKTSISTKNPALEALRQEFYPLEEPGSFIDRNAKFEVTLSDFLQAPYLHDFGGDVFNILDERGVAGASQIKYYKWDLLKPQIYFCPEFEADGSTIRSIHLSTISEIIGHEDEKNNLNVSAELAYFWVRTDMRGKGLGKDLFNQPLDEFSANCGSNAFLFTIAMGNAAGSSVGKDLLEVLLNKNRAVNGVSDTGKVIISSVGISWEEVSALGIDSNMFQAREASKATEALALKYGMKFCGYSKNLSPTFGLIK